LYCDEKEKTTVSGRLSAADVGSANIAGGTLGYLIAGGSRPPKLLTGRRVWKNWNNSSNQKEETKSENTRMEFPVASP
jgi:hypothetical protein